MKKLGALIGGLVTISVLAGCGSQSASTFAPMPETLAPAVSAQSTLGLKSFYTLLTEKVFVSLDTNKDRQISFDEFRARQNMTPGFSRPPSATPPEQPITTQNESVRGETEPVMAPAPTDPLQTFLRIDKNKNGRITLAEAKASKYFLGVSQLELRKMFKPLFDNFDADKNNSISKPEFMKAISGLDQMSQQNMVSLFYTGDKNLDNKLNFSEYEDIIYASMKAMWDVPNQTQPAPPSDIPANPINEPGDPGPLPGEPDPTV